MRLHVFRIFLLVFFFAVSVLAENKTIQMITFEAPPYMDPSLPEQGAAIFALRQVLAKAGYTLKVSFAPLKRAKMLAQESLDIAGYFPASPYDLDSHFTGSHVVYESPWVIAERKDRPIEWKKALDLKKYVGGASLQYTQPTEIVDLMKNKKIVVEMAPDDTLNLIKLANKRIDYAFIDPILFQHLLATNTELKPYQNQLQLNAQPVEMLAYKVAFRKTVLGRKALEDFNRVLVRTEFAGFIQDYLRKHGMVK